MGLAMYVLGGVIGGNISANVLKFDSAQGSWSEVAPKAKFGHAACVLGSDIYVFGGSNNNGQHQDGVYVYDTEEDTWTTLAPMPLACMFPAVTAIDGQIYVNGVHGSGEVLQFDPVSGVWSNLASTLSNRRYGFSSC
jgi:N-acetylneuraminic acid mutarotase